MIDCTSSTTNIHQSPQNKTYMFGQPSDSSRWKETYGQAFYQKIVINNNGALLGERNRTEDLYLDGHKFYVDCSFVAFHPNADIEENKTLIKKSVEDFIEYVDDTFDSFNPVGGPVQCETLKFSEEVHDDK